MEPLFIASFAAFLRVPAPKRLARRVQHPTPVNNRILTSLLLSLMTSGWLTACDAPADERDGVVLAALSAVEPADAGVGAAMAMPAAPALALTCEQQCNNAFQACLAEPGVPKSLCTMQRAECLAEC